MIEQLYDLIGQKVIHENQHCTLIEVLEDGPHLVFQCQSHREIQCNQYGNPHRRSLPTYTIHCLNEQGNHLHPVLRNLLDDSQQAQLLELLLKHSED